MKQASLIFYNGEGIEKNVSEIFERYLQSNSIFKDKSVLYHSYFPERILHRDYELMQLSSILAPAIKGYKPSNIFVYGGVGTGKTVCVRQVLTQLENVAKKHDAKLIKIIYLNCKMKKTADTEYRVLSQILESFNIKVPETGLPTEILYKKFFEEVDKKDQTIIIVLDEIDALVRKIGDEFLYNITRADLEQARISLIGITNSLTFSNSLDIRVKSSLGEEEILFKPYNAMQLKDILMQRAELAFYKISEEVIAKCAAIAAQEHGDARRAIDLLRVAGEIAERVGASEIKEEHVDMAEEKISVDCVLEAIKSLPKQSQAVLHSILKLTENKNSVMTGEIIIKYRELCRKNGLRILTQRRISDILNELETFGIIEAKVISKGRYGRTREIELSIPKEILDHVKRNIYANFK
ncbi:MAG: orc1/cdc6 family replication initiation protein [Candidatus Aenigmarchaeota archaeon]|nr:orc1/cdc6 family replication initiation protein [Candidatus Aenigmarchaeota archaeon]